MGQGSGFWECRRRRHSAASSSDPSGFVVVTHPFHPLRGQRLEVLYVKRRVGDTVFVCAGGVSGQITLPQAWTDPGEPPLAPPPSARPPPPPAPPAPHLHGPFFCIPP